VFIDYDALGVAAKRNATKMLVRRVVSKNPVWTKLFVIGFALVAREISVNQTPDTHQIAGLVFGDCRSDIRNAPYDLVAGDNRINSRHELVPLVSHRMEIRVADTAEENLDSHVAFGGFAPWNRADCEGRRLARSGIGFRFIHEFKNSFMNALHAWCA
jgi:hypothetical protein